LAYLIKKASNVSQYTSKLEEIANKLEDIYDDMKSGSSLYKMGEECDEELQAWYGRSMAESVAHTGRDLVSIANELRDYAYKVKKAEENESEIE
jgi:hypothetical protein